MQDIRQDGGYEVDVPFCFLTIIFFLFMRLCFALEKLHVAIMEEEKPNFLLLGGGGA